MSEQNFMNSICALYGDPSVLYRLATSGGRIYVINRTPTCGLTNGNWNKVGEFRIYWGITNISTYTPIMLYLPKSILR